MLFLWSCRDGGFWDLIIWCQSSTGPMRLYIEVNWRYMCLCQERVGQTMYYSLGHQQIIGLFCFLVSLRFNCFIEYKAVIFLYTTILKDSLFSLQRDTLHNQIVFYKQCKLLGGLLKIFLNSRMQKNFIYRDCRGGGRVW